jgi:hypothetical protein
MKLENGRSSGENKGMRGLIPVKKSSLTPKQFEKLSDVPPEIEWLANITNEKTLRGAPTKSM